MTIKYQLHKSRLRFIESVFRATCEGGLSGHQKESSPAPRGSDAYLDPKKIAGTARLAAVVAQVLRKLEDAEDRGRARSAANRRCFERCVEMLVCNLAYLAIKGERRKVMVPLSKTRLTPRMRPAPFMTQTFPCVVKAVGRADLGIAVLEMGSHVDGTISTLAPGPWLLQLLGEAELDFGDFDVDPEQLAPAVQLKGAKIGRKAPKLPLPDDPCVAKLLSEMTVINDALAKANVDWVGSGEVDTRTRRLTRVFNNGSFDQGGRLFHGFWQTLSKEQRRAGLRLDGREVVEVDFVNLGVRLAYARLGIAPASDVDLYVVPGAGGNREGVKRMMGALLCSPQPLARFPQGLKAQFAGRRFPDVYGAICKAHPALVTQFGTSQGLIHQRIESDIIVRALIELAGMGITALPVHDCLLVGREHAEACRDVMERAFLRETGVQGRAEIAG